MPIKKRLSLIEKLESGVQSLLVITCLLRRHSRNVIFVIYVLDD